MKGKLIKTIDGYELFTQGFLKGSTNHEIIDSLNVEEGSIRYKLSVKNCQAIEHGYDLDELAYEFSWNHQSDPNYGDTINIFKSGFQKAIELMGDKKFTEEDIKKMMKRATYGWFESDFDKHLDSIQQTEWDVEIVMERVFDGYEIVNANPKVKGSGDKIPKYDTKPKLGADGCLILKRI